MMRPALRVFLLWLLAMLVGLAVVSQSRFTADMSFFLPSKPSVEQQVLVDQLREGSVSRLLMLAIEGGDASARAQASRLLRERLAAAPEFATVQNGEMQALDADIAFLLKQRYMLSPAVTPARFNVTGLKAAVNNSIDLVSSAGGVLFKPYLTRDPTGEMAELLLGLQTGAQPHMREGVWASRDGERAMLLLQTRALGSDTDGQEAAISLVRTAFAGIASANPAAGLTLQMSGPGVFAVEARAKIKAEVSELSLASMLAVAGLLALVYRRASLVLLTLVPVLSGALAGVVAVSLVHGTVFGITVGFGSALIGEAVDYGIYFFVQSGKLGMAGWRERFWPTIRLGVMTSVFGFGALLFSGFPGLAQLGLYALTGVLTAAVVTRLVLPPLAGQRVHSRSATWMGPLLQQGLRRAGLLRWPAVLLTLAAMAYLFTQRGDLWQPNLSALSTVSNRAAQLDGELRADLGAPDARYLVVVTAPEREAALEAAERVSARLDELTVRDVIGGYDTPTRFMPSAATQQARRASLPPADVLKARLEEALTDSPLSAQRLEPFLDEVEQARAAPNLTRDDMQGTGLALLVDSLLLQREGGWSVLLPLRPAVHAGSDIDAAAVRTALQGSEAVFIDMKQEFNSLYGSYIDEAIVLSCLGLGAIVVLLAASLRDAMRLWRVLVPLIMSVVLVVAGLLLQGTHLHLLHLIGMLLIVAVGSNYALFFESVSHDQAPDADTILSIALANTTTVIGFGVLCLSSTPVLQAVGATVAPGAFLALVLSAAMTPRQNKA